MFRTVPLSIIRIFSLYAQQWYMSYRFADSLLAIYFWNKTLHVSDSSSVHHQEFFTVHTAMVYVMQVLLTAFSQAVSKTLGHIQINIIRQSLTQYLFYIQQYICQGDMFRPSRSSSGPSRTEIQAFFKLTTCTIAVCTVKNS